MYNITVSVIMGVYNTEDDSILSQAIDSILNQTLTNFEFIICDDGSTDGTYEFLSNISNTDHRIILIRNETNMGLAATLNKCIAISKGKYIARMDADDISAPNRLEEEYNYLESNKQYSFVGCCSYIFNQDGIYSKRIMIETPQKKSFLFNSPFMHPTIMIRKEVINAVNGYRISKETRRAEDYDLFMRLYYNDYLGYNLQQCLYYYREDATSMKKRKYRYRVDEAIVRYKGFKKLNLLPLGYIYIIKPLIVGLLPSKLLQSLRKVKS